ncbi:MAG: hypothetical protein KBT27_11990, partial [Prevotellaceae bacterium]|nr:hypothetical protein [Candidatus Faecinaster equi]
MGAKIYTKESDVEQMFIDEAKSCGWMYKSAEEIERPLDSVLVEPWLKESLLLLNKGLKPDQADQVIYQLRTLLLSVPKEQLVQNNNKFRKLLFEENSYP